MFDRVCSVAKKFTDKAFDATIDKLQPDYHGANGLASSMAALVMADGVVEDSELKAMSSKLIDLPIVREKGMIREVSDFFLDAVNVLQEAYSQSEYEGNVATGEMMADIAKAKASPEWAKAISETTKVVTSGGRLNDKEKETRRRILEAIR